MNEDSQEPTPETSQGAEALQIERRSVDLVLQGAQAIGEVSAGLGTLAIGVSQLKKTFRGGEQSAEAPVSGRSAQSSPNSCSAQAGP
jgi:hypothetical protein